MTQKGLKPFFSGREDKHTYGIGFLINKDTMNSVMGCRPVSSELFTIRLKATPFNIALIQAYVPTGDCNNDAVDNFC